mmetsp:Transcript_54861/g.126320  ORF Transcript_54861/g.126320 Transcript_54861/m.126320 type:complete len:333 (-) Transcript_54861:198-1196(-)|eukprot:CAMPEP_0119374500 /NCGR_PEP_ID=MMETSP1334-20130426/30650_1 /TAXON_ID=127549 /ORGANISM="Calcidiscus leptoporus, Strain RCC1130" /LENGTH=332 /DNA_ID=CAMNT_0007392573 /DNA_START=137 /DNA_END=1135 /DNA_ORIENTATION=+
MPRERVLVTGATGQQGGATVDALLAKRGFEVFALTRNSSSPAAVSLAKKGATVLKGDFTDKASLEEALRASKATQVFLVTDFWKAAKCKLDVEVMHGTNVIDAVKDVDPSIFVVYSSVGDADRTGPAVQHFHSKALVEKHLAETLDHWSVLRPCSFLENLDDASNMNPLTKGRVKMLLPADVPMKYVSTIDIGKAAAKVFTQPGNYAGKHLELATCMHTGDELAAALTNASGTPCKYGISLPRFVMRFVAPDLLAMLIYWEGREGGYTADVAAGQALVGTDAMDAAAWFARKGRWGNGRAFGEPDPPNRATRTAVLVAAAGVIATVAYRYLR